MGRPQNHWAYNGEHDIAVLAAHLLYGIAKNHPFEQANKRTAQTCAISFIQANGYVWIKPDDEESGRWVIALVNDEIGIDEMATFLGRYIIAN